MLQYPEGSLGHRLGMFLTSKDLHSIPKAEKHDVYHVLLKFKTDPEDEAAMQFFLLGNGKFSPVCLGVCLISALMLPECSREFWRQYNRGKAANSISNWNFKMLLSQSFDELQGYVLGRRAPSAALFQSIAACKQKT